MPHSAATGEHIAGILGIDFLSQYSIGFSATDRVIRLYAPDPGRFRCHVSSGRKTDREMMCRWISEVPSQIRSSLESRHNLSTGRSSIRPMPP